MEPQNVKAKAPEQPKPLPIQSGPTANPTSFGDRLKAFFKNPKKVIIVAAAAIFLLGGAAAAYFNTYLPNKPENRLVAALANAANEDKVTIEATANGQFKQAGTTNDYDATFSLVADNNNLLLAIESQVAGGKYSGEVRFIGNNLFFRVSGLSSSVLQELFPSANTPLWNEIYKAVEGINDQWYKFEQTPTETEMNCLNSASFKLNDKDKQAFKQAFKRTPPLVIKSTAQVNVDGQPTTKFQVTTADGKTLRGFIDGIANTSLLQDVNKCDSSGKISPEALRNEINESLKPSPSFNIYIDSNNQIKKMEFALSGQEGTAKIAANFKWGVGSVSKPEGAKPVQDLINDIFGASSLDENIFDESIFNDIQPDALLN